MGCKVENTIRMPSTSIKDDTDVNHISETKVFSQNTNSEQLNKIVYIDKVTLVIGQETIMTCVK